MKLTVQFGTPNLTVGFSDKPFDVSTGIPVVRDNTEFPVYDGAYEVTPTQSTQTLATSSTVLIRDIVVNPIPSNYGLITYNGAILTVS